MEAGDVMKKKPRVMWKRQMERRMVFAFMRAILKVFACGARL